MSEVVSDSGAQKEAHALRERWRETAEASLKGAPLSTLNRESEPGLLIEPLYWGSTAPPESRRGSDAGRAGGSTLCMRIDRGDWRGAQKLAMEAVEGGAAGLVIAWGGAGEAGVYLPHAASVDKLLAPLWLEGLPLYIEPGRAPLEKASLLMSALSSRSARGAAPPALISLGIDPLGGLTRDGLWREPLERLIAHSQVLAECWGSAPWLRLFEVDEGAAHEAGADEAQGLAFTLSVALEYLRQIEAAGGALDQVAPFTFHLRVDPRPFHSIAKLRAFRQLWARVSEVAGLAEGRAALRVSLSARSVSAVDPWVNLLRGTVSSFAALTAGVEAYEVPRFDLHYGAGPLGRRLSRNTGLILSEEGQLGRVEDPAGGSAMVEAFSAQIATESWRLFQQLEAAGGARAALRSGLFQGWVRAARARREAAIRYGERPLTGISAFPLLGERRPTKSEPEEPAAIFRAQRDDAQAEGSEQPHASSASVALSPGALAEEIQAGLAAGAWTNTWLEASGYADLKALWLARREQSGAEERVEPLEAWREAEIFEQLRAHGEAAGEARAQIPLLCFGTLKGYGARATFAENCLAAGGIAARRGLNGSLEQSASEGPLVFCAADDDYLEGGAALERLVGLGGRPCWTVGTPKASLDRWRALGWQGALQRGVDLPACLESIWAALDAKGA